MRIHITQYEPEQVAYAESTSAPINAYVSRAFLNISTGTAGFCMLLSRFSIHIIEPIETTARIIDGTLSQANILPARFIQITISPTPTTISTRPK